MYQVVHQVLDESLDKFMFIAPFVAALVGAFVAGVTYASVFQFVTYASGLAYMYIHSLIALHVQH